MKNNATVLALKKIAQMTRGVFVGSGNDVDVIEGIVALTGRDLRPDAVELASSSSSSGFTSATFPVDSGLNSVNALANGDGVVVDFNGDSKYLRIITSTYLSLKVYKNHLNLQMRVLQIKSSVPMTPLSNLCLR